MPPMPPPPQAPQARRTWRVPAVGAVLTVHEHGRPAPGRRSALLVHGYPDDHHVFDGLVAELLGRPGGAHVLVFDTRGAAATPLEPGARVDLPTLADDLRRVVASLPLEPGERPVLVGHDWGSVQCWEAVREPWAEQALAGFVSISGPSVDHLRGLLRAPWPAGPLAVARQLARSWYAVAFSVRPLRGLAVRAYLRAFRESAADPADARRGARLYAATILPRMLRGRPPLTRVPTTVVHPDADRFLGPVVLAGLQRWAPDVAVRHVAGGHWWPREDPRAAAAVIGELLDAADGRAAGGRR